MAKLTVFLDGTQKDELELTHGKEYLVGRGTMCDVVLDHPKVSRQHIKLTFDGKNWNCRVLSRFGNVQLNGHSVEDFSLVDGARFTVPPFEMRFVDGGTGRNPDRNTDHQTAGSETISLDDKTQTAAIQLQANLVRIADGETVEEIKVGREKITAGRSQGCEIILKAPEASRRHFTIEFDGHHFILTDLKSANKTFVNDKEVTKQRLESGDEITIGTDHFRFELVHPDFDGLSAGFTGTSPTGSHSGNFPVVPNHGGSPAVIKVMPGQVAPLQQSQGLPISGGGGYAPIPGGGGFNLNKIKSDPKIKTKGALVLLVIVILYLGFGANKKDEEVRTPASGTGNSTLNSQDARTYDHLTPEQKKFVEDTYNLAMSLYTSTKYDQASIEIEKIFKLVVNYKDSRTIYDLCRQARDIQKQQDEQNRIKAEAEELKRKVAETLDSCEVLLNQRRYTEVEGCAQQIENLDPENQRASDLVLRAKEAQAKIEASASYRAEQARRKDLAYTTLNRADKHYRERNYMPALREYQAVRNLAFVDTEHIKVKADAGVKAAKTALMKQSNDFLGEGKTALDQKDYASAFEKFSRSLAIYPNNGDALQMRDKAAKELHLEMKNLYGESVIEENLGNISSAIKKWQQILKADLKSDDYYQKAKIKLQRYEK